jgi:hypothetical protein
LLPLQQHGGDVRRFTLPLVLTTLLACNGDDPEEAPKDTEAPEAFRPWEALPTLAADEVVVLEPDAATSERAGALLRDVVLPELAGTDAGAMVAGDAWSLERYPSSLGTEVLLASVALLDEGGKNEAIGRFWWGVFPDNRKDNPDGIELAWAEVYVHPGQVDQEDIGVYHLVAGASTRVTGIGGVFDPIPTTDLTCEAVDVSCASAFDIGLGLSRAAGCLSPAQPPDLGSQAACSFQGQAAGVCARITGSSTLAGCLVGPTATDTTVASLSAQICSDRLPCELGLACEGSVCEPADSCGSCLDEAWAAHERTEALGLCGVQQHGAAEAMARLLCDASPKAWSRLCDESLDLGVSFTDCEATRDDFRPGCEARGFCDEVCAATEYCDDGIDNDCNGLTDADDPGCACDDLQCEDGNVCNGVATCIDGACREAMPIRCAVGEHCEPDVGCVPGLAEPTVRALPEIVPQGGILTEVGFGFVGFGLVELEHQSPTGELAEPYLVQAAPHGTYVTGYPVPFDAQLGRWTHWASDGHREHAAEGQPGQHRLGPLREQVERRDVAGQQRPRREPHVEQAVGLVEPEGDGAEQPLHEEVEQPGHRDAHAEQREAGSAREHEQVWPPHGDREHQRREHHDAEGHRGHHLHGVEDQRAHRA